MTLKNPAGIPLVNTLVKLTRPGGSSAYGYTDSLGQVSGMVPSNETLLMEVLSYCMSPVYSQNIGPFSSNTNLGVVTVTSPTSTTVLVQGTVVDCSGLPITNGYVIIFFDYSRYVSTNSSGQFSLVLFTCGTSSTTIDITAVDNTAQQQGTVAGIPIVSPVTNTGNVMACGISTAQFINYTLDGTNYALSSSVPSDSLIAYSWFQGTANTYISGSNIAAGKEIWMNFVSPSQTPGTYPLTSLNVQGLNSPQFLTPNDVIVTSFPIVTGGFFEGSMNVSFKDSSNLAVTHTLTGTFRVRKL